LTVINVLLAQENSLRISGTDMVWTGRQAW